jgi:hypothetical protein
MWDPVFFNRILKFNFWFFTILTETSYFYKTTNIQCFFPVVEKNIYVI